ncbi:condensation domain-containing protein [uncultured Clostridium sp.]|uniref:condensation domain-containing protein n=1 Tax=uncultured Clostridium sp. TaxID=59620 RepID=UPI0025CDA3F0|nr:condensation domain-containing protein [uncultured Clostridium sp.]
MLNEIDYKSLYPLTAAQKLHFYTLKYCPKKQVLNIGTSLTIKEDISFDILKESIYEAYSRCEAMRLRFVTDLDGNVMQYVADKEERDIELYDFSGYTMKEAELKMREWTETPFERENSPLNKVVMIITPDNYKGIYLLVDHMTMDAQSLIVFLRDIIEIYCYKRYEGIEYPKEMYSYIKQIEKDLEYESGSKAQYKDREYFKKLIEESEPIYNDIDGIERLLEERHRRGNDNIRNVTNVSNNVDANITVFSLEEYPSHLLLKFCEENKIPMVCLLMMALRTYLQKFNNQDDVSIMSTVARRATLSEKKSGGTRIHCFPCRTIVSKRETFMDGIKKIRYAQNSLFRHANFNPVEYLNYRTNFYNNEPGQTYEPLSLTYQPLTMKETNKKNRHAVSFDNIDYKTNWYSNGVCAHALYLTVMHRSNDNGLDFNFEYQTGRVTPEKLQYMYYYICRILFEGINNPYKTIEEIIESV